MRLVANRTVLANRRMFDGERSLLFRVALVAQKIDGRFLEVVRCLTVGVVAIGAHHFPFHDGMVRGKLVQSEDFRMALVARLRLLHAHRQPIRTLNRHVADIDDLRHVGFRVRIVAIGAGDPVDIMRRRVPRHRGSARMTLQAEILPAFLFDLAMGIVARGAVETVGSANLMRAGDLLEFLLIAMALVANARRYGAQIVRSAAKRRELNIGGGNGWSSARNGARLGIPIAGQGNLRAIRTIGSGIRRFGCRGRSGRNIVVPAVAVRASHPIVGMRRNPPTGARRTGVLLVALETGFRAHQRVGGLETQDQTRLLAAGLDVAARRTVARFAFAVAMHVFGESLGIIAMARRANFVVIDVLRVGNGRKRRLDDLIGDLLIKSIPFRPTGIQIGIRPALRPRLRPLRGLIL